VDQFGEVRIAPRGDDAFAGFLQRVNVHGRAFRSLRAAAAAKQQAAGRRSGANFTELIHGNLWNRLIPRPRAADRDPGQGRAGRHRRDSFRAGKQMEGRGPRRRHNWCQPTLRNGGLLIDLSELNKVISIDVGARKAVVQRSSATGTFKRFSTPKASPIQRPLPAGQAERLSARRRHGMEQGVWGSGTESIEASSS